eukprot:CAMPEP_0171102542 /NCGR_PEP_ID=MMETSP0766_2-20121228/58091_1 /TAXON_ID=439317 /ORGANISM="Gambierdiscus australes, Strain CAWD 149" /LENGTH=225 /DNA_ID=CAMNT_0011562859 /DNA_START=54 /DNA_END=728 /DNA_ORIENTATION=+
MSTGSLNQSGGITRHASRSLSEIRTGRHTIIAKEPSYVDAFYGTTNAEYRGHWHDGVPGNQLGDVPKISEILAARPTVKKPVRPLVTTARTLLADQIAAERRAQEGEKVLSADRLPKKFPVEADAYSYPEPGKRGANNPLYSLSSQNYGQAAPDWHQMPDRYFPSNNKFTHGFVETKPRYTGLNCAPTHSKAHKELDQFYEGAGAGGRLTWAVSSAEPTAESQTA